MSVTRWLWIPCDGISLASRPHDATRKIKGTRRARCGVRSQSCNSPYNKRGRLPPPLCKHST
jgi:hypothetical protein